MNTTGGFTLIEMVVVLFILSVLLVGGMQVLIGRDVNEMRTLAGVVPTDLY